MESAVYHTVVQGEYLSYIAAQYGFTNYLKIWNHPQNAALKALRKNAEVLHPGDKVFIPEREAGKEKAGTGQKHKFVLQATPLKLKLVIKDVNNRPVAGQPCTLTLDGNVFDLTTNDSGEIEKEIPNTTKKGRLVVKSDSAGINIDVPLLIGHIDPVEEKSGQVARLENLGYSTDDGNDDKLYKRAVEEFQRDNGLTVDGICGPVTQNKLKQVFGS